jgi:hypothetical protein
LALHLTWYEIGARNKFTAIISMSSPDEVLPTGEFPYLFHKLSLDLQAEYSALRDQFRSPSHRYNRNRRLVSLQESFDTIRSFCIRGDRDDALRCLVCGIFWFPDGQLATNTRQLHILLAKSKSNINGALVKMKYETLVTKDRERDKIIEALPDLKADWLEVRQWTIRRPAKVTPEEAPNPPFPEFPVEPATPDQEMDFDDTMSFLPCTQGDGIFGSWDNCSGWPFNE